MRKIQINTQNNESLISISLPGVGKDLSPFQRILEIATYIRIKLVLLLLIFIPTSIFLFSNIAKVGFESSIFVFLIVTLLLIIGFYVVEIILAGSKKLIDPPGMLNVLIFALLATTSAVLIPLKSSENTFGTVSDISVKGITGISVIIFLCLFYFVMLLVKSKNDFQKILSILNWSGIIFFSIFLAFFGYEFSTNYIASYNEINLLYFAHIAFTAISIFQFFFRKGLASKFTNVLALLISLIFFLTLKPDVILIIISLLITGVVMTLISLTFIIRNSSQMKGFYKTLKVKLRHLLKTFKTKQEIDLASVYSTKIYFLKLVLLFSGPAILLISILLLLNNPVARDFITLSFNSISASFTAISIDGAKLATGLGASTFNGSGSLVSGVIESNGLIGTLAYLVIFISAIWAVVGDLLNKKFFDSSLYKVKSIVYFLVLFGIASFFIIYPGIIFLSIWWIMFALVFGFRSVDINLVSKEKDKKIEEVSRDDYDFKIVEFGLGNKIFGRNGKFAKLFITGIVFVAFVIFAVISVSLAGRIV